MTDLDERLDRLFGLPLESFTKERNALVRSLRDEGRAEEAAEVAALKKPVLSAWVTNQLVRRHVDEVRELVELQGSLGSASADEMRAGIERRRRLVTSLTKKAGRILVDTGRSASTTVLQRVSQNLLDTSTAEERAALSQGRLSSDLEGSGLGMWAMPASDVEDPGSEDHKGSARAERARREAERLEEEARAAENEARELVAIARDAEARAEKAKLDAEGAQRKAERARARADAALERL